VSQSAPVTKQEFQAFATEIRDELSALSARLRPTGAVQTVTMPAPAAPPRTERLVWVMCAATAIMGVVAGGATVAAVIQGQRVTDLRSDMHAERASREAFDNWNAQEITAVRAYITTGRLQPMHPRPQPEKPQ
jgi:hypothetical protein